MKSFVKFLEEDPSLSDLIEYQISQLEQTISNVTRNRDQFQGGKSDFDQWMVVRYEGQIEILEGELTSLKYKLRQLND